MSGKATALACALLAASVLEAQPPPVFVPPGIQQQRLVRQVRPVYPKLAKEARIQGRVRLAALIDEDGVVERLKLMGGHPLLVQAAMDAVAQWRYRPFMRNGRPAAVVTTIEVPFTLRERPPAGGYRGEGIRVQARPLRLQPMSVSG